MPPPPRLCSAPVDKRRAGPKPPTSGLGRAREAKLRALPTAKERAACASCTGAAASMRSRAAPRTRKRCIGAGAPLSGHEPMAGTTNAQLHTSFARSACRRANRAAHRDLGGVCRQQRKPRRQRIHRICGTLHGQEPRARAQQRRKARDAARVAIRRERPRRDAEAKLRLRQALRRSSGVRVERELPMHGQHARVMAARPEGAAPVLVVAQAASAVHHRGSDNSRRSRPGGRRRRSRLGRP